MLKPALGRWLSLACLCLLGTAGFRFQSDATPMFTVSAASAYLRNAPSAQAPATYSVFAGQVFAITGRNSDNSWMQLDYPRAAKGTWILASLGKVSGDLTTIPVIKPTVIVTPTETVPATSVPPTVTPSATDPCEICVLLYNDGNGDGRLDSNENALAGGRLTLLDTATGGVLHTYTSTSGESQGHCFTNLPPAAYTVAAAPPPGYNATSEGSLLLQAQPGQHYDLTFGAQASAALAARGQNNFILGMVGAAGLLLAAGLVAYLLLHRH